MRIRAAEPSGAVHMDKDFFAMSCRWARLFAGIDIGFKWVFEWCEQGWISMIPNVIYQTARTKPLVGETAILQNRAKKILKGWSFTVFDDIDNQRLINDWFPDYANRFSKIKRGVIKADIARLVYVFAFGGFYIDTDYKVLRNFDFLRNFRCVLTISGDDDISSDGFLVCNSFLASESGHPLWRDFLDHIFSQDIEELPENRIEEVTGPVGLTRFFKDRMHLYQDVYLTPRKKFAPRISHFGLWYDTSGNPYGAHICFGSWRSKSPIRSLKDVIVKKIAARI